MFAPVLLVQKSPRNTYSRQFENGLWKMKHHTLNTHMLSVFQRILALLRMLSK